MGLLIYEDESARLVIEGVDTTDDEPLVVSCVCRWCLMVLHRQVIEATPQALDLAGALAAADAARVLAHQAVCPQR